MALQIYAHSFAELKRTEDTSIGTQPLSTDLCHYVRDLLLNVQQARHPAQNKHEHVI
jgi:hypothetical protein